MSHISRIRTQMTEQEYILKGLEDLGFSYETGNLEIAAAGRKMPVNIKIKLRLSSDIGLRKTGNSYEIVADWFSVFGTKQKKFTKELTQRYAYHAAKAKLEEQGFTLVSEDVQEKGKIRMVLRRTAP